MVALELMRYLRVNDEVALRIKRKVMQVMAEREAPRPLSGFVQVDDAYLGGERNGGKSGCGSENKQAFLVALQTDETLEHPSCAVIEPVRSFDNDSIQNWPVHHLAPGAEVFSDGLFCFRRFADAGHTHTVLKIEGRRATGKVQGACWVNVLLGNLKRAISGRYHAIRQAK